MFSNNRSKNSITTLIISLLIGSAGVLITLSLFFNIVAFHGPIPGIIIIVFLLISLILQLTTADQLKKIDAKRFTADADVKSMYNELEKKVEERSAELHEADLKFRIITEKSLVGIYMVQNGKYSYVNPRFAQIFGYQQHELINTILLENLIHKDYHSITAEHLRRRLSGEVESAHYETVGVKKDGSNIWVEFYGSKTVIGNIPTIIGSVIDITERKNIEEELKSSEHKYKVLFESNPMPMWMIAKDTLGIIDVNKTAANQYGYTRDELIGRDVRAMRPKEDMAQQLEGYQEEMDRTRVVRHLRKDGTMMYIQLISYDIMFEGRPVRLSLTNDITEKLKAEEALKRSEANLKAILNTTDIAYALFDIDLMLLAYNQKAIEFITHLSKQVPHRGDRLPDHFPLDKFPQFNKHIKEVLQGDNISYEEEYPQEDGSVIWYCIRLFPIVSDSDEVEGMLLSLYDITAQKEAEQSLQSAYTRIQNHIESIKDMAWKQSHLIRSPLANLQGLAAMLKCDKSDTEIIEHLKTELKRMDSIIIEMAEHASEQDGG